MLYALPILAAVAAVNAQGVTSKISPSTPAPSGCVPSRNGKFGLNIVPIGKKAKRQLSTSTISSTTSFTSTLPAILSTSTITSTDSVTETLPAILSTSTITSTSSDIITLPGPSTLSTVTKPSSTSTLTLTITSYTTINGTTMTLTSTMTGASPTSAVPVTQIGDGQIQQPVSSAVPVTQIGDGQIQQPVMTTMSGVHTILSTMSLLDPVTAIGDGQLQATTMASAQISIATSTSAWTSVVPMSSAPAMGNSTIAPNNVIHRKSTVRDGKTWWSGPAGTSAATLDKRAENEWSSMQEVNGGEYICASTKPVVLTLQDSVLLDEQLRTGSVVANQQLQFDGPAQNGAIYTAGFSICENNTLALGGSTVWYQCRTGSLTGSDYYNLYFEKIADYCEAVEIKAVEIIDC